MRTAAVIVAAGRGTRAGGGLPKQWRPLAGRPVIARTLEALRAGGGIDAAVVVLHPDDFGRAAPLSELWPGLIFVAGGDSRAASVRAGLEALADDPPGRVLIHDAARPIVAPATVRAVLAALETAPAAAPGLEMVDALWRVAGGEVAGVVPRADLVRAQTPQGFRFNAILAAHRRLAPQDAAAMPDDVAVARAAGLAVRVVAGDERNIKITRPEDFSRAEALLADGTGRGIRQQGGGDMDVRVGNGFDVHRFGPGTQVILCGVAVPHERALIGHSDADVGLHALTDAVLGALALGDIGQHFPPTDPRWKGADSARFLAHAVALAAAEGYRPGQLDVTLICEAPRIGPHVPAMRARVAEIAGVAPARVSVKATTTERLGFTGRGEGIAAMATATLVTP